MYAEVAKTLSFIVDGKPLLVVLAGDARMDHHKFKEAFGRKGRMIPAAYEFHGRREISRQSFGRGALPY